MKTKVVELQLQIFFNCQTFINVNNRDDPLLWEILMNFIYGMH